MSNFTSFWSSLDVAKKLTTIASLAAFFLVFYILVRLAMAPTYVLLFGNLDLKQSGEIVGHLERLGVDYRVRQNSVLVPEEKRDELRMTLASQNLPSSIGPGYEILDQLTGFGTTSQMFEAAYSRAIEGELARTIVGSSFAKEARVHISKAESQGFGLNSQRSASVFVLPARLNLTRQNSKAVRYLVASAVTGLDPKDVTVVDSSTGIVIETDEDELTRGSTSNKAKELKRNVERILEARVGPNNARVELYLEYNTDAETIVERTFDPNGQVAISTDSQEISRSSSGPVGNAVTVASNVPSGDASGENTSSSSQDVELRERTNYEVSEVHREIVRAPGAIRRLTVAVLVNDSISQIVGGETQTTSRTGEELEELEELVKSIVGYNEDRGDVITLKALKFEPTPNEGAVYQDQNRLLASLNATKILSVSIISLLLLLLGLFVIRPIFQRRTTEFLGNPHEATADESAMSVETNSLTVATKPQDSVELGAPDIMEEMSAPMAIVDDFSFDFPTSERDESSMERLKLAIDERKNDTVEILRAWMESPGKKSVT